MVVFGQSYGIRAKVVDSLSQLLKLRINREDLS